MGNFQPTIGFVSTKIESFSFFEQLLKLLDGRMERPTLFGWYHLLKALRAKKMTDFDLLLIAVRPDYQDRGINALIVDEMTPYFAKYGIERVETTAILETNNKSQANFVIFDHIQHKRRRAFVKTI